MNQHGLNNTFYSIPDDIINNTVNSNFGIQYLDSCSINIITHAIKGRPYDPKAAALSKDNNILCGHTGLYANASDMYILFKSLINNKLITRKHLFEMSKNRTGRVININEKGEKKYSQYLGYLCYSKNPNSADSEVRHLLSGRTIGSAGFNGTQFTIDPINQLFFFLGANRTHNRVVKVDKSVEDKITTDEFGKKSIILPNGEEKVISTGFAWDRDIDIVEPAINLSVQYRFLEEVFSNQEEKNLIGEKIIEL